MDVGEGYRLVRANEKIKEGDQYLHWIDSMFVGKRAGKLGGVYRRKLPERKGKAAKSEKKS